MIFIWVWFGFLICLLRRLELFLSFHFLSSLWQLLFRCWLSCINTLCFFFSFSLNFSVSLYFCSTSWEVPWLLIPVLQVLYFYKLFVPHILYLFCRCDVSSNQNYLKFSLLLRITSVSLEASLSFSFFLLDVSLPYYWTSSKGWKILVTCS